MTPAAETCSGRSAGVCARRAVTTSSASPSRNASASFMALIAPRCPFIAPSLHGYPHRAYPDDLPVGLHAAHVVVTGLPLLRGVVAPTECDDAIPAGRVNDQVVFDYYHTLKRRRAEQSHAEDRLNGCGERLAHKVRAATKVRDDVIGRAVHPAFAHRVHNARARRRGDPEVGERNMRRDVIARSFEAELVVFVQQRF